MKFDIGELGGDNERSISERMRRAVDSLQLGEFTVSPVNYDFSPLDGRGQSKIVIQTISVFTLSVFKALCLITPLLQPCGLFVM